MPIPTRWKVAGATAAATGLALGGVLGLAQNGGDGSTDDIDLRDTRPAADVSERTNTDRGTGSPSLASVDSPLPATTLAPAPTTASPTPDSPQTPASVDSPAPAPSANQAPAPAPNSPASPQTPASPASVASPASPQSPNSPASVQSADSD